jgi:hypothetical protein
MGKWANGQMGKWANGQMGKWANGQMGKLRIRMLMMGTQATTVWT